MKRLFRRSNPLSVCFVVAAGILYSALFTPAETKAAPTESALNLAGKPINPFQQTNLATVFIFVAVDCPISNKYAPEIQRLRASFEKKKIPIWVVYADPDAKPAEIEEHVKAFSLGDRVLRDPNHFLVKLCQAAVTPEAAIFDRNQKLVYHGRIDDRFAALGRERSQATRKDLQENLDLLVNGKPLPVKTTRVIGCQIPELRSPKSH